MRLRSLVLASSGAMLALAGVGAGCQSIWTDQYDALIGTYRTRCLPSPDTVPTMTSAASFGSTPPPASLPTPSITATIGLERHIDVLTVASTNGYKHSRGCYLDGQLFAVEWFDEGGYRTRTDIFSNDGRVAQIWYDDLGREVQRCMSSIAGTRVCMTVFVLPLARPFFYG
jgi:hypothetical protein